MFQLLIFFMLSSGLNPYSMLTIGSGDGGDPSAAIAGEIEPPPQAAMLGDAAVWNVGQDAVITGGQRFAFEDLPRLAEAAAGTDASRVILIADSEARVQDVATVLEALTVAGVLAVQLAPGAPS